MFVLNSKFCRELRVVLHKPSVVEEGVKWFICGLAKPKVQPIHSRAICPVLLHVGLLDAVQRAGRRSRMYIRYAWEISPTLILVPIYLIKEKQRRKQTRALPA
jgi:hypothetical protein